MKSRYGKLNAIDVAKGFFLSVIGTILTSLYQMLAAWQAGAPIDLTFDAFKPALIVGAIAGISYLIKNLGENSQGKLLKKEKPKAY